MHVELTPSKLSVINAQEGDSGGLQPLVLAV